MTERSPLHQQVDTLPELVATLVDRLVPAIAAALPTAVAAEARRVFLTGCGDSHHAAVNAELAFEQLAGLPCEPMPAMQLARYAAGFLPHPGSLTLAVSVSGNVSRTAEALDLARKAGSTAVAVTGNPQGVLAAVADVVLPTAVPALPAEMRGQIVPGARSYVASQLALYLTAVHLGQQRGHLTQARANRLRAKLAGLASQMEATIATCDPVAAELARWDNVDHLVFCGAGPNFGTALFAAAKILEASGETAVAQDTEEWAHLDYFAREAATPTFLINAGGWETGRALEVATAAHAIGRRVVAIAPSGGELAHHPGVTAVLPVSGPVRECFSPLLTCLPALLFAASRAQALDEPYFRDFGGGRSIKGGGGISRIRNSARINTPNQ